MSKELHKTKQIVSVILPTYNSIETINRAVNSILIQQINYLIEIIIIDDSSTDGTYEKVKTYKSSVDFQFRVIRNNINRGVGYSRNVGLKKARGDFIAFLDSDDYWIKDKLKVQLSFLELNDNIDFVTTNYLRENHKTKFCKFKLILTPNIITLKKNKYINYIPNSTCLLRSRLAKKVEYPLIRIRNDYVYWNLLLSMSNDIKAINCHLTNAYTVYGVNPGISYNKFKLIK